MFINHMRVKEAIEIVDITILDAQHLKKDSYLQYIRIHVPKLKKR